MYCCCWSSPAQFRGTQDHILLSQFLRLSEPGGPGSHIYIPQEQGVPVIPLGTGFPFRLLLRLARGLRPWSLVSFLRLAGTAVEVF
jgi:hypothetical protein